MKHRDPSLVQRRTGSRRHQAQRRSEAALFDKLLVHDVEVGHDGIVLLLGPGVDGGLIVVAEEGESGIERV